MSFTDWLKRLFSPTPPEAEPDYPPTVRAEYGEGGLSGLTRVEGVRTEEEELADDPPSDPTA